MFLSRGCVVAVFAPRATTTCERYRVARGSSGHRLEQHLLVSTDWSKYFPELQLLLPLGEGELCSQKICGTLESRRPKLWLVTRVNAEARA